MKLSTLRFTLAIISIFPAATMCALWAAHSVLSLFLKGDLSAIPFGFPFVSCLIIYVIFIKDTLKLYKEGK